MENRQQDPDQITNPDSMGTMPPLESTGTPPPDPFETKPLPETEIHVSGEFSLPENLMFDPSAPAPYTLHDMIGRGGFGEVFEATQAALGRTVALKRIREDNLRAHMEDPSKLQRMQSGFRKEALIMASLEHPNIVPIHDLVLDVDGHPLLVMKLVRGEPWDRLIRRDFRLPVDEFLARHIPVLMAVGQAVAFAHSRGVIHRDIKPSQIMVGEFGEVQLMDWGIAVTRDEIELVRRFELKGEFIPGMEPPSVEGPSGTAAFMAPEQTARTIADIGPWTDVYLLGGSLYFLLTGRTPHTGEDTRETFIAAQKGVVVPAEERARGGRKVPEELSSLAMRAMAPNIIDRLPSAEHFVSELQDYLTGVTRHREAQELLDRVREMLNEGLGSYERFEEANTMLERAVTLNPRHEDMAILRDQVAIRYTRLALDNGDVVLARVQAERMRQGRERAELIALTTRLEQEKRESAQRLENALRQTRDLVSFMLQDLHEGLQAIGRIDLLQKVAQKALEHLEALPEEEGSDELLRKRLGALRHVADILKNEGKLHESEEVLTQIILAAEHRVASSDVDADWELDLSDYYELLGVVSYDQGNLKSALDCYSRSMELRQKLSKQEPENLQHQGRIAWSFHFLSTVYWRMGDQPEALRLQNEALAIRQHLVVKEPESIGEHRALASVLNGRAWVLRAMGDLEGAIEDLKETLRLRHALSEREPGNLNIISDVAWSQRSLALVHEDRGEYEEALEQLIASRDLCRRLIESDPANPRRRMELAFTYGGLGRMFHGLGSLKESEESFLSGMELQEELCRRDRTNLRLWRELFFNIMGLTDMLLDQGRMDAAENRCEQALQIARDMRKHLSGSNPSIEELEGRALVMWGRLSHLRGDVAIAEEQWTRAAYQLAPLFAEGNHPAVQEEPYALALLYLKRYEEAQHVVDRLKKKKWSGREFLRLCRKMEEETAH